MWSMALTYQLKPGKYAEYKKAHDELWPELAQAMTENDVNMVIHHHEERLYLYMTAPTEEHFTWSHTGEVADRWLEYMATMMITATMKSRKRRKIASAEAEHGIQEKSEMMETSTKTTVTLKTKAMSSAHGMIQTHLAISQSVAMRRVIHRSTT